MKKIGLRKQIRNAGDEIAACEALCQLGLYPKQRSKISEKKAAFQCTAHLMRFDRSPSTMSLAFTPGRRYVEKMPLIHWGLTSSDVLEHPFQCVTKAF